MADKSKIEWTDLPKDVLEDMAWLGQFGPIFEPISIQKCEITIHGKPTQLYRHFDAAGRADHAPTDVGHEDLGAELVDDDVGLVLAGAALDVLI